MSGVVNHGKVTIPPEILKAIDKERVARTRGKGIFVAVPPEVDQVIKKLRMPLDGNIPISWKRIKDFLKEHYDFEIGESTLFRKYDAITSTRETD